jgi:hypothetical protein
MTPDEPHGELPWKIDGGGLNDESAVCYLPVDHAGPAAVRVTGDGVKEWVIFPWLPVATNAAAGACRRDVGGYLEVEVHPAAMAPEGTRRFETAEEWLFGKDAVEFPVDAQPTRRGMIYRDFAGDDLVQKGLGDWAYLTPEFPQGIRRSELASVVPDIQQRTVLYWFLANFETYRSSDRKAFGFAGAGAPFGQAPFATPPISAQETIDREFGEFIRGETREILLKKLDGHWMVRRNPLSGQKISVTISELVRGSSEGRSAPISGAEARAEAGGFEAREVAPGAAAGVEIIGATMPISAKVGEKGDNGSRSLAELDRIIDGLREVREVVEAAVNAGIGHNGGPEFDGTPPLVLADVDATIKVANVYRTQISTRDLDEDIVDAFEAVFAAFGNRLGKFVVWLKDLPENMWTATCAKSPGWLAKWILSAGAGFLGLQQLLLSHPH